MGSVCPISRVCPKATKWRPSIKNLMTEATTTRTLRVNITSGIPDRGCLRKEKFILYFYGLTKATRARNFYSFSRIST